MAFETPSFMIIPQFKNIQRTSPTPAPAGRGTAPNLRIFSDLVRAIVSGNVLMWVDTGLCSTPLGKRVCTTLGYKRYKCSMPPPSTYR